MSRVIFFELPAQDASRARGFYSAVLGWQFSPWDGPHPYWLVKTGAAEDPGIDGGLSVREGPVVHTVGVNDLDATCARVLAEGGQVDVPRHAVPGVGWLAYFKDTEGNTFGAMQADPAAR
jgi:hypothetical protein